MKTTKGNIVERCVVASPVMTEVLPTGGFQTSRGLNEEDLNYYTLFWDRLVIPGSREIYFQLPREDILIGLDFLSRPVVSIGFNSDQYPIEFPKRQVEILSKLRKDEPQRDWNLHQIGEEFIGGNGTSDRNTNLKLELFDALPVPGPHIHPEQILEFKHKYKVDYDAFHNYLDDLYKDVAYAPDEPLFQKKAYERFRNSLEDINRISEINKGWFLNRYNLSFEMPGSDDMVNIVLGAIISVSDTENPLVTGLGLLQAAKGFIKVSDKHAEILHSDDKESNLLYLARAYKKGVLDRD